ncbi:hypothetical protein E2C01_080851 [Portunus trituberculatus]|uniref:Uncharacterized protein n=1 Tax=Portunus trituberculatus TaxID=210409 RepID=A0A5B7IV41_PORTR|nr:hypothetical protein [Portunus trituberculatus]
MKPQRMTPNIWCSFPGSHLPWVTVTTTLRDLTTRNMKPSPRPFLTQSYLTQKKVKTARGDGRL